MRKKRFDLCREFGCPHKTWSGKAEKDVAQRTCVWHSAVPTAQRARFSAKAKAERDARPLKRVPRMKFIGDLPCMFRAYERIMDPVTLRERTIFVHATICGAPAPRRLRGDRSAPRYPNRFGDPLCKNHAHFANDEHAFPGENPTATLADERFEEHQRRLAAILETAP